MIKVISIVVLVKFIGLAGCFYLVSYFEQISYDEMIAANSFGESTIQLQTSVDK